MLWSSEGPVMPEIACSDDMLRYSNSYLLALPAPFFRQSVIWWLFFEPNLLFLNIEKFVLHIGNGILIDQNCKNAICIDIFRYSNVFFSETTHLKLPARCELAVIHFQTFRGWNNQWFCPLYWNIDRLNTRKGPINNPILSIFKLIIIRSYWLNFFRRVICKCDLLYLRSIFLCSTLTENIAVRLRLLFLLIRYVSKLIKFHMCNSQLIITWKLKSIETMGIK